MMFRVFCYGFFAFLFLGFHPAQSQNLLEDFRKPLPEIELLDKETFDAQTNLIEEMPLGDEALKYQLRLPQDWIKSKETGAGDFSLSAQVFSELATFYGPNILDKRPSIQIRASNLEFQTSAEQWFLDYILERGYTIQAMEAKSDNRVEGIYIFARRDVTYAVRTVAQINGQRIVIFEYFLPADFWADQKALQAQVTKSFQLVNSVNEFTDPVVDYAFLDVAQFQYPEGWELRSDALRSIERFDVQILNIDRDRGIVVEGGGSKPVPVLRGKIDVNAVSYVVMEDLEQEVDALKKSLNDSGLKIEAEISRDQNVRIAEDIDDSAQYIYKVGDANNNLHGYEYWLTILTTYDYYFFITLLTPERGQNYEIWTRNTRAYQNLINSFDVLEESMIYEE